MTTYRKYATIVNIRGIDAALLPIFNADSLSFQDLEEVVNDPLLRQPSHSHKILSEITGNIFVDNGCVVAISTEMVQRLLDKGAKMLPGRYILRINDILRE